MYRVFFTRHLGGREFASQWFATVPEAMEFVDVFDNLFHRRVVDDSGNVV